MVALEVHIGLNLLGNSRRASVSHKYMTTAYRQKVDNYMRSIKQICKIVTHNESNSDRNNERRCKKSNGIAALVGSLLCKQKKNYKTSKSKPWIIRQKI